MSPAVQLFHARIERRAAALAPELRRALLRAYARIAKVLTESQMEVFIRDPSALMLVELEAEIQRALAPASRALRDGVEAAGQAVAKDLPGLAQGTSFNVLNPKVLEAIRNLDRRVMGAITAEVQGVVRTVVERGLEQGIGPREMARMVQGSVGLAKNQLAAVDNFRRMLEEGDAEALTRALRDRRFDAMIKRAVAVNDSRLAPERAPSGLTDDQIDRMTDAYRNRMAAFHAETITRTAALDAQRVGHQLTWDDAVARGDIDGSRLTKRWSGTLDDRERDTHLIMEGETVPYDQTYSNGQMVPGEGEYNCRCVSIFETRGTVKPGAGARGVTAARLRVGPALAGVA